MIKLDFSKQIQAANEGKTLNKPFRTPKGPKKFSVYVKNNKGNVVKVNFGDPNMEIKRDSPERRKAFRSRHNCDNPGPKWKARYWSCKFWSKKPVSSMASDFEDYKDDFYGMIVGSITSIKEHAENILNSLEDSKVKENLTEPFLQQMAILAEDYIITVHNYVMFNDEPEEKMEEMDAGKKQGLWDNIRKKKKRMGKNYKPAKPGSKDRPTPDAWKQAQSNEYEWDGETFFDQQELLNINPSIANCEEITEDDDICEDC
jgi:hypothetical protein